MYTACPKFYATIFNFNTKCFICIGEIAIAVEILLIIYDAQRNKIQSNQKMLLGSTVSKS